MLGQALSPVVISTAQAALGDDLDLSGDAQITPAMHLHLARVLLDVSLVNWVSAWPDRVRTWQPNGAFLDGERGSRSALVEPRASLLTSFAGVAAHRHSPWVRDREVRRCSCCSMKRRSIPASCMRSRPRVRPSKQSRGYRKAAPLRTSQRHSMSAMRCNAAFVPRECSSPLMRS